MGHRVRSVIGFVVATMAWSGLAARADEGGVSFWLPGQYGSFAAAAPSPGFSMPLVFYNYGGVCRSRSHSAARPPVVRWPDHVI